MVQKDKVYNGFTEATRSDSLSLFLPIMLGISNTMALSKVHVHDVAKLHRLSFIQSLDALKHTGQIQ